MRALPVLKLLAALAIATAWPAVPALAQATPAACAAIAADAERLACYDGLFRDAGLPAGDAVVIQSERMIPAQPTGRAPATMTIACAPGGVIVSFGFANQLVSNTGDISPVTFQLDAGGTSVRTLQADAANTQLSFGAGRDSAAFLDTLAAGTSLKVRMTPVRQRSLTVDFRLAPAVEEIAALRASCG